MATVGMGALAQASVFTVTHIGDSGPGSLRQAILDANANAGADTIQFTFAVGSPPAFVNLLSPLPAITGNTTIIGQGQTQVIVETDPITNPGPFPLITITGTPTVEIRGLSFTRGGGANGGAILAAGGSLTIRECTIYANGVTNAGGGVAVVGSSGVTLNIIDSTIQSNTADVLGGGVAVSLTGGAATVNIGGSTIGRNSNHQIGNGHLGGGLYIGGGTGPHTVSITASTINDNSITTDGQGGGASIDARGGTITLVNTTISGNNSGMGSALAFANAGLTVRSCTITANSTVAGGTAGCVQDLSSAGLTLRNTIVSGNISGGVFRDLDPGLATTGNNNLIGIGGTLVNGANGNITGVTDPRLFPMNINGGLTQTFALMPDSPALDHGSNADAPATDQRGQMRPSDGDNDGMATADIGAFETQRYLVTNTNNSGLGSLRQAILDNNTAGGGYVKFAIPTIGQTKVIFPKSPLPPVMRTAYIDAWSQGGQTYQGPPLVEIDGVQIANAIGLDIQWSDCMVRGLAITDFLGPVGDGIGVKISTRFGLRNWIYGCYIGVGLDGTTNKGNGQYGVWIASTANGNTIGTNADGLRDAQERNVISGCIASGQRTGVYIESNSNTVSGNNVGTDVTGQVAVPNFNGIWVVSGSSNQIGASPFSANPAAARNVVSGNTNNGVSITSLGSNNFVSGNYVGVKGDGASALPNVIGVALDEVNRTLVGGTSAGERNVISGNTQYGVLISGTSATGNLLQGNYVGTSAAGTAAIGNGLGGILVRGGASFTRIGAFGDGTGSETGRRNVISGNAGPAVLIQDAATTDIRVMGNYIGLSADGAATIGNVQGVAIVDSPANIVGAPGTGRNFICGQTSAAIGDGVTVFGTNATTTLVQNNWIGVRPDGTIAGNAAAGVSIANGAVGNTVGGVSIGEGNTIAGSGGPGVRVLGDSSLANAILGNSINANGALGIDLVQTPGIYGVTANGPANVVRVGPNALQNYPVIQSVTGSGLVTATLTAIGDTIYRVEFFSSVTADPSGYGEGRTFLGSRNVTTNSSGVAGPFTFSAAIPAGDHYVSATATQLAAGGAQGSIRGFPTDPGAPLGTSEFAHSQVVNTAPTTQDQTASTLEDTDVTITLLASDADAGTVFTFRVNTLPGSGQLLQFGTLTPISAAGTTVTDAGGRVVFRPAANDFGSPYASFAFQASDGIADSNQSTVTVGVLPVNDRPNFAAANPPAVPEDSGAQVVAGWAGGFSPGPANESAQTVLAYLVSGVNNTGLFAAGGQPTVDAGGTLRYTPAPDAFGTSQFTVRVQDNGGTTNGGVDTSLPQTFTITVLPVNDAPSFVAANPPTILEDAGAQTVSGWVTSVIVGPANEAATQAVQAYLVSNVTNGSLFAPGGQPTVDIGGTLRYTPAVDANGTAQFTVRVRDDGGTANGGVDTSAPQTFTITVLPVNDAPSFVAANPPSVPEDSPAQTITGWAHDFSPGPVTAVDEVGQANLGYSVSAVSNASLFASGGQPTVDASGTLRYTPAPNVSGSSQFTVRVRDGGGTANGGVDTSLPQTFTIVIGPINDPPTFVAADPPPVLEDSGPAVVAGWAHDFVPGPADEASQTNLGYTVSLVSNPALFTAGGQPTVDVGGTLRYTPAPDAFGTAEFTVTVRDSGGTAGGGQDTSAPRTFLIVVQPVNDPPSFVAANPPTVLEDAGSQVVAGWAHNVSVGPLNESMLQSIVGYTVSGVSNPALFAPGGAPTVDNAGVLRYTPAPDANGTSQFTVVLRDDGGTTNGGIDTSTPQTFTITVTPVNDAPSFAASNPPAVLEDAGAVVVPAWVTNFTPGPSNEGSQAVQAYLVSGVTNASLFSVLPTIETSGTLRYTPAPDANGTATFTVRVQDNGGTANGGVNTSAPQTFTVTVLAVNDPPSFVAANPAAVLEDSGAQTVAGWAHNFLPGPATAVDETGQTNLGYTVSGVSNASLFAAGGQPTVDASGALRYTPAANANGTSQITVRVQDSGGTANGGVDTSAPQTFTITVLAVNDAPSFVAADPPAVLEDAGPQVVSGWAHNFSPGPPDEASQTVLTYLVSGVTNASLFAPGGQPTVDNAGVLRYTSAPDANGTAQFTVRVQDSGGTASGGVDTSAPQTFTITVRPVNDPPAFTAANPPAALQNSGVHVVPSFLASFNPGPANESGQTLAAVLVDQLSNGSLFVSGGEPSVATDGTLTYSLAPGVYGSTTFRVRVRDSGGTADGGVDTSAPQTFSLAVYPLPVCHDVTIDARTSCPPLTVQPSDVNHTPTVADPAAAQAFTYSRALGVNFPIGTTPVIVTVTYTGGLTASCTARVTVLAADCNNDGIPDACQGGGTGNQTDCNNDGIPDDCQCVWDDGMITAADATTANGQLSHLGSAGSAVQAIDDFYLPPNQIYRLFGFRGQMFTNSLIKKARLEFYEDCNGRPADVPFKTVLNPTIEAETPATDGYTLVSYFFDLCSECFTLEGGKCYWVSMVGLSDNQHTDLSYWATTTPTANPGGLMGLPPMRRTGIGGPVPYPYTFTPWQTTSECCEGCVNLAWRLTGEGCLVAWDNGSIDLNPGCGSPSGADRANPTQPRSADNFVMRGCDPVPVCFVETWIWTNCSPVHGFAEIYESECAAPTPQPGVPWAPPATPIVPGFTPILTATATKTEQIPGATLVYNGLTLYAYKLTFCDPGWTLQGGRTYWISSGSAPGGSLNGQSLFACAQPPCASACTKQISNGMFLNRSATPLQWADTGQDFAFRIAVRGSLGLVQAQSATPAPQPCRVDVNNSGAVDTQDIFDYLNMWFTGCP